MPITRAMARRLEVEAIPAPMEAPLVAPLPGVGIPQKRPRGRPRKNNGQAQGPPATKIKRLGKKTATTLVVKPITPVQNDKRKNQASISMEARRKNASFSYRTAAKDQLTQTSLAKGPGPSTLTVGPNYDINDSVIFLEQETAMATAATASAQNKPQHSSEGVADDSGIKPDLTADTSVLRYSLGHQTGSFASELRQVRDGGLSEIESASARIQGLFQKVHSRIQTAAAVNSLVSNLGDLSLEREKSDIPRGPPMGLSNVHNESDEASNVESSHKLNLESKLGALCVTEEQQCAMGTPPATSPSNSEKESAANRTLWFDCLSDLSEDEESSLEENEGEPSSQMMTCMGTILEEDEEEHENERKDQIVNFDPILEEDEDEEADLHNELNESNPAEVPGNEGIEDDEILDDNEDAYEHEFEVDEIDGGARNETGSVNNYEITLYEELKNSDDEEERRARKPIPAWAANAEKLHYELYLQNPTLMAMIDELSAEYGVPPMTSRIFPKMKKPLPLFKTDRRLADEKKDPESEEDESTS